MAPCESYEVEELTYKRYAACGGSHQSIEAALANEHDLKPDDIESIEIFGVGVNSGVVGVPWTDHENPHVLAQFCAPYQVASVIEHRRFGPAEITNERIAEAKEVDALARRTHLHSGWSREQTVRMVLRDGRELEATRDRDDVLSPELHSYEQLVEKFKYNAVFSGLVPEQEAAEMVEAVENLDKYENIGKFIRTYLARE